ncbi:hypothetical protein OB03_13825 [Brevundimonas sp. GN22]|uniref:DUF4908 domain-containing protein n=1 Tax=Brevundimonas pishanensis TaxID=2896315 RepID=UPI001FA6E137|nr:DUF4908 domain-containing protein [Brevundimonas pishanensis]
MNSVALPMAENPPVSVPVARTATDVDIARLRVAQLSAICLCAAAVALAPAPSAQAQVLTGQERNNAQTDYSRQIRRQSVSRTTPAAGRYQAATGQGFVVDNAGSQLLLRFDRSNETWVLRPSSAPRGDTIYRNDAGEQVLRVTSGGGMTLYSPRSPGGSPVSMASGTVPNLQPQSLGPIQLFNLMTRRSGLISDAVGRLVQINVYGDESEALCVEALIVSTDTVIRIARSPSAKPFLERLRVITVVEGNRSAVTYSRGELRIVVDPSRGVAGRPSSARIIRAIIPQD